MYGPGFSAPKGTVRISLANLYTEDYVEIARRLFELLDEYYEEYEEETSLEEASDLHRPAILTSLCPQFF